MFNFHKDHRSLVFVSFLGFLILSLGVAVFPAYQSQENTAPLPTMEPMTEAETNGLHIFVNEGCVACHTQQVRSIEMDKTWGDRPSIPSDYYYSKQRMSLWRQSPSVLGSERTGPDLTNIGKRQPSEDWHLLHLYNPRIVVKESIMPSYPWLFEEKSEVNQNDQVLAIPEEFSKEGVKIVPTKMALDLVAYLQSLKQAPLTTEQEVDFIPSTRKKLEDVKSENNDNQGASLPDGQSLYTSTCAACHQAEGTGLPGAFPPLAGSSVVNDEDPELLVRIILQGYDARPEYAQMPGFADQLSDEEIAAIANHERSSWGNDAPSLTAEDVKKIRELVMNQTP
ncbi:cytochrome c oxidase cbb3-type subunit 2 [Catalinimonas alkaloidigena]|uniref:cbb3-type cytochrome c oxidase subunit II n=1 Tax=Catalinimonas alkaloidigena TaxID=1075417 RepID=UPI002406BE03|nr:cbb3-type cytochrome c oxidase subunit II [Catalinimonas alkaloidigena]MDF9801373.1 cytochrome c oxidase cbb3-type subunit 2 [Catalinimonas alkaloidigena]